MNDIGIIHLTNGGFTVVDAESVQYLNRFSWSRTWDGYVNGYVNGSVTKKTIGLGRFILGLFGKNQCDHINGHKIDYRKSNLREVTPQQNQWNQGKRLPATSTSKYKGVYWSKGHNSWRAQIRIDGNKIHLGSGKTQESAAMKYNEAAKKHFGQYARLNIIDKEPPAVAGEQKGLL